MTNNICEDTNQVVQAKKVTILIAALHPATLMVYTNMWWHLDLSTTNNREVPINS